MEDEVRIAAERAGIPNPLLGKDIEQQTEKEDMDLFEEDGGSTGLSIQALKERLNEKILLQSHIKMVIDCQICNSCLQRNKSSSDSGSIQ